MRLALRIVALEIGLASLAFGATIIPTFWSEALRQPCERTMYEWKLETGKIDTRPVPLNAIYEITELTPKPVANGLLVRMDVRPCKGKKPGVVDGRLVCDAMDFVKKRFGDKQTFDDWSNLYLAFYVEGGLRAVRAKDRNNEFNEGLKVLPTSATVAQQTEAITWLTSH